MDNKLNETRGKISALRAKMLETANDMHVEIARGKDCSDTATRLMALRAELAVLIRQQKSLGDPGVFESAQPKGRALGGRKW